MIERNKWPALLAATSGLLFFSAYFIWSVVAQEQEIASGIPAVLEFTPRDPRSLMQGDYMLVGLKLEGDIVAARRFRKNKSREERLHLEELENSGEEFKDVAVLANGYARLKKMPLVTGQRMPLFRLGALVDEMPSTQNPEAPVIAYRVKDRRVTVGSGNYFFQEGSGDLYARARFVQIRILSDGSVFTESLLDEELKTIQARDLTKEAWQEVLNF